MKSEDVVEMCSSVGVYHLQTGTFDRNVHGT